MVALLLLSYRCIVTVNVLWLFVTVPWVGLQCVIVVFPDHRYFTSLTFCHHDTQMLMLQTVTMIFTNTPNPYLSLKMLSAFAPAAYIQVHFSLDFFHGNFFKEASVTRGAD